MTSDRITRDVERLLEAVTAAMSEGDFVRAHASATAAVALAPESAEARAYLDAATRGLAAATGEAEAAARPAERPDDADSDGSVAGRYQKLDFLGRGSRSEVYRARDELRGREIALKLVGGDEPVAQGTGGILDSVFLAPPGTSRGPSPRTRS